MSTSGAGKTASGPRGQPETGTQANPITAPERKRPAYLGPPDIMTDYEGLQKDYDDEEVTDQAYGLPDWNSSMIIRSPEIQKLKFDGSNLKQWKHGILSYCTIFNVAHVIRQDLPRPIDREQRRNWRHWSQIVCSWMYLSLDEDIPKYIFGDLEEMPDRADDIMCAINFYFEPKV